MNQNNKGKSAQEVLTGKPFCLFCKYVNIPIGKGAGGKGLVTNVFSILF